ncbi:amino acid adenylation domain-containing protein [Pseudomonas sp. Fl5BN2]|uniref:non-ribosomal peptide synthetase n=1 Tax=Pseudomonas sp. Fl5BN2 TaxID=2697652 RepID=UPI00137790E1|nr:amino acid adenylation domain-containing protein [Pseudomonas sp. Fl5BN2]
MSVIELLATLKEKDVQLVLKDDQLVVQGNKQALSEAALLARLRAYKPQLIELIRSGQYSPTKAGQVQVPANGITPHTRRITPELLPLADLDQPAIERIVATVPGGVANVQDIYPLAPLQEGILYHHVSAVQGDPYVMQAQFAFDSLARLQAFAEALRGVIARHDILRTAVLWDGLEQPMQVVWREAGLILQEVETDPAAGEVLAQLHARFDARHYRLDISQAPMLRLVHAWDAAGQRIVAMLLFHHMALDHSALDVVRHEMQAFLMGQAGRLGPALPFRNYVAQARLGVSEQEHETFFRQMLGDIDEPTLPFGLQDVQGDGRAIDEASLALPPLLNQRLRAQARKAGVSAASLFHLAWGRVLGTLAGKHKVVFGTVLMGRMQGAEATDRALGIFINTLPFRLDVDGQGLGDALKATHGRLTTLLRHEHAALALAQRCSGVSAPTPLFSALLNYRHSAAGASAEAQAAWAGISTLSSEERTNYPLTLSVDDLGDAFSLTLLASTQVDPQRILGYLLCTLENLAQALEQTPQLALEQLSILPPAEREQLLDGFNRSLADYPRGQTVHGRIQAQAARTPNAVAAWYQGRDLSYGELDRQANVLARQLRGLGVQPDDRVAIVARRSLETLVGLLAILKSGACYVPIDPAHPAERLRYLLDDSGPQAVLIQADLLSRLPALAVPVIELNQRLWQGLSVDASEVPELTPGNLAYVIYTSGSTGLPKGVMVEHQSLCNLVDWHCQAFDLQAGSQTSSLAGFGFDAMAWEVWPALCVGATLHLAPAHDGTEDVDGLLAWWRAHPLDVSFLPTPVAEYAFSQDRGHPTLSTLLIGGDRLRQFSQGQSFALINNYGPTEATVVASSGLIEAGQGLDIGRPVANARIYLLDEQQRPVPIGVAGELYVGGVGVARGYLNRPELTAERFLKDPFSAAPGARMYRSGDLARWLADGRIEYLGRNDDQVKIRGVRIELGEIETRLNQFPGIKEAVLLAREDQPGNPRLVAYFTEHEAHPALVLSELRGHLLAQLPDYMVPVAYVKLDALPLTANGKLDRKALPAPDQAALFTREYEAAQGPTETTLAAIWCEVLHLPRVGRHDHFFELGGHSLLAMRMVSQVRQRLGVELALGELFANAELSAVAAVLDRAGRSQLPEIFPALQDQDLPLSFAQQRLWFLAQIDGAGSAYNIPIGLALRGQLDRPALQQALHGIVSRHATLRSRFVSVDDQPQVLIGPIDGALQLAFEDLAEAPLTLAERVRAEAAQAFDLEQGPVIRGRLLRLADDHHVLLLTLHHIVADGWSMGVLTRELVALYEAFSQGRADPLPPLAVQYSDFALWQRRWLSGEVLQQQGDYWRQALAGAPTLLVLPSDRPRPQQQDFTGGSVAIFLDSPLTAQLKTLSQRHGCTLYMTLLAGWALLLGRLSAQSDLVIGSPVANRMRAEVEGLIGLFVNTLALRLDVSGEQSVAGLLAQVRARSLEAQAHQDLPFEQVVEIVRPQRSLSHSPLFQAVLAWVDNFAQDLVLGDLKLEGVTGASQVAKFDLTLSLGESQGQIRGSLDYASALFDAGTVQRFAGYLVQVLRAMVADDQQALARVQLLEPAERRQLLEDFNASAVDYPRGQTLNQRFAARVAAQPEAIAVLSGTQRLSYGELDAQANQLAHYLRELGVGPDSRVAICVERGPQMVVGLLAILKAGGAYVPIDPSHPEERIAYLLQDSAPLALLVQGATRRAVGTPGLPLIDLDRPGWQQQPLDHPQVPGLTSGNLAYVIYTSGSTGLPKGVMVEHGSLANLVDWHCQAFDLGPGRHTSSVAGFGFDAMAWEVWPALCGGATLHLPPANVSHQDIDQLLRWWQAQPLDVSFLPTPVAEYAFSQGLGHPHLRTLLIGGDRLRQFSQGQSFVLINNYGPTEATVVATSGVIEAAGPLDIGRPIANARIYLLDEQQKPVPLGVAGELYVGGAGVARGYLNRPELTAERFLKDPFGDHPDARMYRSGDLARWLADGRIEYLGRNDDQVKIRGVRIELGEIETCLNRLPGIKEAVLLVREDSPGQSRLVAYFTASGTAIPTPAELRTQLLGQLPEYMVPAAYVHLQALPLTANGKLDRRALPQPQLDAVLSRDYEAPQGASEVALAQIWSELLHLPRVGRQDHFFELGGHSLLAMRMLSQVRQRLGVELALGDVFANAQLSAVAEALARSARSDLPDLLPVPAGQPLPLSFAQQRLWFLAQMEGANTAYNIPIGLRLRGQLDGDALLQALERIVARHETLRSRFAQYADEAEVVIAPVEAGLDLRVENLRGHPQAKQALQALVQGEASAPFDLQRGPLIRGRLIRLADDHHVLLLTLHHIVSDGWSMGVLTRELVALYHAFSRGLPDPLPPLAVQYSDFAHWQRRWLSGAVLEQQAQYWRQALDGAPPLLMLPTDRPRPAQQDYAGSSVEVRLDSQLTAGLRALSQRHGTTLYMTLLGAWGLLLGRLSGQAEVVIGTPVANRMRAEVEGLIGLFVNTLALRLDLGAAPRVETLLAQVKARTLEAQAHQHLPFEQVVEILRPLRSLSHSPLFQTLLTWQSGDGPELVLGDLRLEGIHEASHFAKFDLSLSLGEVQDRIEGSLEFATALFDEATVQRYAGYLQRLLQAMVADDQALLEQLPLLDSAEREQLLEGFNATTRDYALEQTLHGLFEAQVLRSPEALALQAGEQQLSYRELNQQANQLAGHLRQLGVGPDSRVAICVERGLPMVLGLLAILKAGGAYVPIDPAYPRERIAYMLQDSAPLAVLVQGASRELLGSLALPLVDLEQPLWNHQPPVNPQLAELSPSHLAYVIYTSGSTGQPKGVMNEHRAVVNRLLWMQEQYRLTAADAVLQKTPFSFDVSVWEFFWPLFTGARLVMARPDGHKDPAYLRELIQREGITTLHFVPSMLDVFLAYGDTRDCAGLRQVMCSGEALPGSLVRRFKQQLPSTALHNLYGPTEAAVDVTAWDCAGPLAQTADNTPIGKPIANTRMYLLDGQMQPVPRGVVGELYIGGVQVARGYLNREQLTAERFLEDPFSPVSGGRMYRTGDLGCYLVDGTLEYLGRNDDQVKIRGLRIELGEIQARLTQLAGVKEAVVLAREDVPGDQRLVAYYTTGDGHPPLAVEQLRLALLEHLPDYMVPALFVHLEALPLSPNGKLERKALPAPGLAAATVREYQAPVGEVEILLAQLWAELLKVERVGRHDHFFELGGHSLLAVSLIGRMRRAGLSADVRVLFGQPTLAALAAAVGRGREVAVPANLIFRDCPRITPPMLPLLALDQAAIDRVVATVPGGTANVQDIYPLAPLQAGILYHHLAASQGDPYVLQAQFAFDSSERLQAFARALQGVIERNDILRSAVLWEGLEEPLQVVWRKAPLAADEIALNADQGDILGQLQARFDSRRYRLDIAQAPLLRLVYARDPVNQRLVALLLFHHLVMDHVALEVLQHELQAFLLGQHQRLGDAVPYRNYVAQARLGIGEAEHEAFFRQMLGDIDQPTLPLGLQEVPGGSAELSEARQPLDRLLSRRLRLQARQLGVSAASLMHLAWGRVLGSLAAQQQVVFGTVLLGRMQGGEGAERALGVFINTLPLRVDLGDLPVRSALLATHERLAQLLGHEQAPLALVQRCSAVEPGTPLFSSLLNYRHSAPSAAHSAAAGEAWAGMQLLNAEERSNYPLTLSIDDLGDGFMLTAVAAGIDARRICDYLHCTLENLLLALEQDPQRAIGQVPVLPAAERQQLLVTFNATARDYPRQQTLQQRFEEQVLAHPQQVAAVHGEQALSYAQLNTRANQLAHHLLGLGVQPGDTVALLLPRSLDLLLGQLAICKCAAAYVPLDINAPAERLSFMVEDCQAVVVLSHRGQPLDVAATRVDLDRLRLDRLPGHNPGLAQSSEAVAYIMYTSGSTGMPKGVLVPHRAITRLVINNGYADFNPADRVAFASNPAFDASTMDVWGPLLNGGRVVVVDHATLLDPEAFGHLLTASGATLLFLTTSLFNQYVQLIPQALKGLRMLLCGGERADPSAFRRMQAQAPYLRLVNGYGPTETTTFAVTHEPRELAAEADSVPIGRPLSNTCVYVLDAQGQLLPIGVVGELYIGGQGVAKGYLKRPELTAEKFLADPFSAEPEALMYRTGDLGRWLENGLLECIGRNDEQVKIRGFRIEPGEIEARLASFPGLRDAVVLVREDAPGDKHLVAYYTVHPDLAPPAIEQLRGHLQAQLPEYMVPLAYVQLQALPLTNNGKLDRKALPLPTLEAQITAAFEAPENALEQTLAQHWAEVLKLAQVGRHEHFFERGGHSLLAIQLVNRLQQAGFVVSLAELFQHASVAAMARLLSERTAAPERALELIPVRSGGTQPPLFLVHEFTGLDVYFPALGQHLEGDFPIYGLPGVAIGQPQLRTLECLATRLLEVLRGVQPQGPYRLAGWSFGGVLAYEIAQQLLGLDQEVEFLGLIDSYVPRLTDQGKARWSGAHAQKQHLLLQCHAFWSAQGAAGVQPLKALEQLRQDLDSVDFAGLLQHCREQGLLFEQLAAAAPEALWHYLDREVAHGHALAHYCLHPLAMPVHLFCAAERPTELSRRSPTLGWGEVLGAERLHCVSVPGDHLSMMKAPHIRDLGQAMSRAIAQAQAARSRVLASQAAHQPLLRIQSGNAGQTPIFCVPGAGDSVTGFIGLTEALGADWPILGLQARGLDGHGVPHGQVEVAAEHYLQAIEAEYPAGPLHLIGHSFGGWVAFEMAGMLQAAGREVASLTLIDSEAPGGNGVVGRPYTTSAALWWLIESMQLASGQSMGIDPELFAAEDHSMQMQLLHAGMVRVGLLSRRADPRALHGPARTFATALRTRYQPQRSYQGPVRLVLADDPSLDAAGNRREQQAMIHGWRRQGTDLQVWYGPGNHFSLLKAPNVYHLAAWWHDGLSLARGEVVS